MPPPINNQSGFDADDYAKRLTGPMGLDHFNGELRECEPAHFPDVFSEAETSTLCSPELLADLLMPNSAATASIDIYANEYLVRLPDMLHKSDRLAVEVIAEQLQQGATIRFRNLERCNTKLNALTLAIDRLFHCTSDINAYLTPAHSDGFPPHFDNTDVLVVQLIGVKQWHLYPEYSNRMELPLKDTPWDADKYRPSGNTQHRELHPGDVLYIPRGGMHSAACKNDLSLHLTISLDTETRVDQLSRLMLTWAEHEASARRRLPDRPDAARGALLQAAQDFYRWLQDNVDLPSYNTPVETLETDRQKVRDKFRQALGAIR